MIEYAGKEGPMGKGALLVDGDGVVSKRAKISKLLIRNAEKAFNCIPAACAELAKAEHGNQIDDKPFSCPKEEE